MEYFCLSFVVGALFSTYVCHRKTITNKIPNVGRRSFSIPADHKILITCLSLKGRIHFRSSEEITLHLSPLSEEDNPYLTFSQRNVIEGALAWDATNCRGKDRNLMLQFINSSKENDCEVVLSGLDIGYIQNPKPIEKIGDKK